METSGMRYDKFGDFSSFGKQMEFMEFVNKLNAMVEDINDFSKKSNVNLDEYNCEIIIHEVGDRFSLGYKYTKKVG